MEIYYQNHYHFYNRTNNHESAFREDRNFEYFLKKYRKFVAPFVKTFAYCLMPTHFHFFIQIQTKQTALLSKNIGTFLSSYAKGYNNAYNRNGSLFQQHSKAILVDDDSYFLALSNYIHQNPVRADLAKNVEGWPFSSFLDLCRKRKGTFLSWDIIDCYFKDMDEFVAYSNIIMKEVKAKYWV